MSGRALVRATLVFIAACGNPVSNSANDLLGSWGLTESVQSAFHRDLVYDFHADGTYATSVTIYQVRTEASTTRPSSTTAGRFTTEGNHLNLWPDSLTTWEDGRSRTEPASSSSVPCTFEVGRDELTLVCPTDTGPTTLRLHRIR